MARYVVHIRSPLSVDDAFAYMADLSNFAEWDPGVDSAELVEGDGPGPGAGYDVTVKAVKGSVTLRYHLVHHEPPTKVVAAARSRFLTSLDTITVTGAESGSLVTYEAELTLNGPLGVFDRLLGPIFERIGDRAAIGLVQALKGERASGSEP